jgi:hypothetical protein
MDKIVFSMVGYALLIMGGWRAIKEDGRKLELLLFVLIAAWCMYMSFAHVFKWQSGSVTSLQFLTFARLGKLIETWLGGSM